MFDLIKFMKGHLLFTIVTFYVHMKNSLGGPSEGASPYRLQVKEPNPKGPKELNLQGSTIYYNWKQ